MLLWHNKQLVASLNWSNWFVYQTFDRAERTLALFGIGGGGCAGLNAARASWRLIRRRSDINMISQKYISS
jgi:hypothetical protein